MKLNTDTAKGIAILAGTGLVLFVAYKLYKGAGDLVDTAKKVVTEDLNPASDKNIVYSAFNTTNEKGEVTESLGTRIYNWFHPDEGGTLNKDAQGVQKAANAAMQDGARFFPSYNDVT